MAGVLSSGGGWRATRPGLLLGRRPEPGLSTGSTGSLHVVYISCTWSWCHLCLIRWSQKWIFQEVPRKLGNPGREHPLAVPIGGLVGCQLVIRQIKSKKLNCISMHIFRVFFFIKRTLKSTGRLLA